VASIQKRVRNGKISYRVRYRDPTGRQRSKVFARKVDADNWLHANETAKQERRWVDPAAGRERFGEWAERWYATTAALRPTTRRDYRVLLDRQVLPAFAAARLADLDALAVREWLAGLVDAGLSAKRTRKAHQVLAQVLDTAVDGDKLARNVAAGVKLPKVQRREVGFLDAVQVEALAEAIDPRYSTLVRFAAYSGLRPCELVALRVGRLDLLRGAVRVTEAAPEVAGRLEWGGVKTP
jgi:integrase